MTHVYLGLGSNLGDREANIRRAVGLLRELVSVEAVSSLYETEPVGYTEQPKFLNAACCVSTELRPRELLRAIKEIEAKVGRTPTFPQGPREIDIDILLYGDLVVDEPDLCVPHPRMAERAFVLTSLAEIAPDAVHPTLGLTVRELLEAVGGTEGVRVYQSR